MGEQQEHARDILVYRLDVEDRGAVDKVRAPQQQRVALHALQQPS